ncbi:hypothetical protein [Latilactobacillus curvatus]|uniref:hypothetical protein n=1 Tax=Latilactobacillus curvatus TaxID=28038 RepID=UPI00345E0EF6
MDSDDISKPSRFLKQMTYLTEHPEVDVLGTDMEEFTGSLEIFSRKIMPYEHDDIVKYAKKRNPMNHPTVIFKKSKAEAVGGYQHCAYFEDYFLWMRMLKNGCTFHNLDESCLYSRIDEDLYRRRGGISYVKNIISFRRKIRKLGMSNLYDTWWLIMIQSSVAMLPNSFRAHIYRTLLRRNEVKK